VIGSGKAMKVSESDTGFGGVGLPLAGLMHGKSRRAVVTIGLLVGLMHGGPQGAVVTIGEVIES